MHVEQVPSVKRIEGGNLQKFLHDKSDPVLEVLATLALAPGMHVAALMFFTAARRAVIDWAQHPIVMVPDARCDSQPAE